MCSKPAGRTVQGICDLGGNVSQWLEDSYHVSYRGAPGDGSAWEPLGVGGLVVRGGSWADDGEALRTQVRHDDSYSNWSPRLGFRLAQ